MATLTLVTHIWTGLAHAVALCESTAPGVFLQDYEAALGVAASGRQDRQLRQEQAVFQPEAVTSQATIHPLAFSVPPHLSLHQPFSSLRSQSLAWIFIFLSHFLWLSMYLPGSQVTLRVL